MPTDPRKGSPNFTTMNSPLLEAQKIADQLRTMDPGVRALVKEWADLHDLFDLPRRSEKDIARIAELEAELSARVDDYYAQEKEIRKLEKELSAQDKEIEKREAEIEELGAQIEELGAQIENWRQV